MLKLDKYWTSECKWVQQISVEIFDENIYSRAQEIKIHYRNILVMYVTNVKWGILLNSLSLCVSKKLLVGFKCWFIFSMEWESRWKYTDGWKIGAIVRCLFLWCYDKKTQSCRALNLILIHFWLVIILTWLIIKAEPSKQEFRFNLLELQNIFLIIHWVLKTDWFINVTWNKKPTRVWDERSFQSPIWIQSNFPNHSPRRSRPDPPRWEISENSMWTEKPFCPPWDCRAGREWRRIKHF